MSLRADSNFGLFSGGSGGGGGGGVSFVGAVGCNGICVTGSPIVTCGTFGISNTKPYEGEAVEVLGTGTCSTLRCGVNNLASGNYSASLGGEYNCVTANYSTIVGGCCNLGSATFSFIGGGFNNRNFGCFNTIGGGVNNILCNNSASVIGSTIGGGIGNNTTGGTWSGTAFTATPTPINIGCYTFIGGGFQNQSIGNFSVVSGGQQNISCAVASSILGGCSNCAINACSTIGGGGNNRTCGNSSTIVGGRNNITFSAYTTIGGGCANCACTTDSVVGGGSSNKILAGTDSIIGGGCNNTIQAANGNINTIVGGYFNELCAFANASFIGGGQGNSSYDSESSIVGGILNNIGDVSSPLQLCCTNTALSFIYLVGNQTTNVLVNDKLIYYHDADGLVYTGLVSSRTYNAGTNLTCVAGISAGTTNASQGWVRNVCSSTSSNSTFSTITGGYANTITNSLENNAIYNGENNTVSCASYSMIGNGCCNSICSETDTNQSFLILNGLSNRICSNQGARDTILNGCSNFIRSCTTASSNLIGNGVCNFIGLCSSYGLIANGEFNKSSGYATFIGNGTYNHLVDVSTNCLSSIIQAGSVIVGGFGHNTSGGTFNTTTALWTTPPTTILDGSQLSFIGGGLQNVITTQSCSAVVVNGCLNCIQDSCYSIIGSGVTNFILGSSGQGNHSVIVSGSSNCVCESSFSFIGTGDLNLISKSSCSVVGGGSQNVIRCTNYTSANSFLGGGCCNRIEGSNYSIIGGGLCNIICLDSSDCNFNVIVGGEKNCIGTTTGDLVCFSFIGGGCLNTICNNSCYSSIIGGCSNTAVCCAVHILGSNITASDREDTTYVNNLNIVTQPELCNSGDSLAWDVNTNRVVRRGTGIGITSIGVCSLVPAFQFLNTPVTASSSSSTICVCGNGLVTQYVRGDGTLATFPVVSGGGGGATYYFNGNVCPTQGLSGYKQMSRTANFGSCVVFNNSGISDGTPFAKFMTDANDPNLVCLPGGIFEFNAYLSASAGTPSIRADVCKYCQSLGTCSLLGLGANLVLTDGATESLYTFSTAVPSTPFIVTDRIIVNFIGVSTSGNTVCLATEGSTLAAVQTTISTGISSLNGLSNSSQFFCATTDCTDFCITSAGCSHCFNLPTASATNRGALSSADWSRFDGCLSPTFPANSFYVNNTNSSATAVSATYFDSGSQGVISNGGSIVYCRTVGGTDPVGGTQQYRFTRIGNLVSLQVYVCFTTAGTGVCGIEVRLPSSVPAPSQPGYLASPSLCAVIATGNGLLNVGAQISTLVLKTGLTYSSVSTSCYAVCMLSPTTTSTARTWNTNITYLTSSIT